MATKKRRGMFAAILAALMLLAGCGKSQDDEAPAAEAITTEPLAATEAAVTEPATEAPALVSLSLVEEMPNQAETQPVCGNALLEMCSNGQRCQGVYDMQDQKLVNLYEKGKDGTGPFSREPRLFSPSEKDMLLRIAMAEVGCEDCIHCLALVMRTVLNRVDSPRFDWTIERVLKTEGQFDPVTYGTFETANPNEKCYKALELIMNGWDESQGAFYYESCVGTSWHSENLELLFQHCSSRFYK